MHTRSEFINILRPGWDCDGLDVTHGLPVKCSEKMLQCFLLYLLWHRIHCVWTILDEGKGDGAAPQFLYCNTFGQSNQNVTLNIHSLCQPQLSQAQPSQHFKVLTKWWFLRSEMHRLTIRSQSEP